MCFVFQLDQLAQGLAIIPNDDPGYAELLSLQTQIQDLKRLTEGTAKERMC
jgi:hypothetical protein